MLPTILLFFCTVKYSCYLFFSATDEAGNTIFCWSEKDKSYILSGYFYTYMVLQVFGGSLAEKFGTKIVLGTGTMICALSNFFIPLAAKQSLWGVFVIRLIQGLAGGVTYPCLAPMIMRLIN